MARNFPSCDHADEEYIDMEISSSTFFCYSINSPPQPREFEFQMSSSSLKREPTTSPADELFYKGNLLPLHLPPRLQMVQNLLQTSNTAYDNKTEAFEENYTTPFPTTTSTPFESCNISPSNSCRVSRELNPDEFFFECSSEVSGFIDDHTKKSWYWSKKLKFVKQSSLSLKLKASQAYLKSLFSKSGCVDMSCEAVRNGNEGTVSKFEKECLNKYMKVARKKPLGQIRRGTDKEKMIEDSGGHRRSFLGAVKRHSATKSSFSSSSSISSSSSFSSANSNCFHELHLPKTSSSANSEIESSIQGAIAHCKQSHDQLLHLRKTSSEVGFCSFSASRIAAWEEQEWPGLCRG